MTVTGAPAFAVLDMRLEDGNGLKVVEAVRERRADARIVMLTGYGAIATAVAAVKAGAVDYLSKPADADDVVKALLMTGEAPEPQTDTQPDFAPGGPADRIDRDAGGGFEFGQGGRDHDGDR